MDGNNVVSGSDESQSEMEIDEQVFDGEPWPGHEYLGEDGYEGAAHSQQIEGEEEERRKGGSRSRGLSGVGHGAPRSLGDATTINFAL